MKLLVVDDSKMILNHAENILTDSVVNCEILLAKSGEEALDILESQDVDIVILDIIMPGVSGIEVLRKIKSDNRLKDIKVLMFSSLIDKKTLQECFEIGAHDYITKPLEEIEFVARVKSVVKEKALENKILNQIVACGIDKADLLRNDEFFEILKNIDTDITDLKKYLTKYNLLIELYQTYRNEMASLKNEESQVTLDTIISYEEKNDFQALNKAIETIFKTMEKSLKSLKDNTVY